MPDPQNIALNYDIGSAAQAAQQVQRLLAAQAASMGNFAVKTIEFNQAGQAQAAVVEQIDAAGRKVTRTFQIQGDAVQQMTARITENVKAQQAQAAAAREAAQIPQARAIAQGFGLPTTGLEQLTTKTQKTLQTAQQQLVKALSAEGLSQTDITRVLNDIKNGIVNIETGPAKALQKAFLNVKTAVEAINAELSKTQSATAQTAQQKLVSSLGQTTRTVFPAPTDASISAIANYSNQILGVQKAAAQALTAGVSFERIDALIKQAAASPKEFALNLSKLPPELQGVAQALVKMAQTAQQANTSAVQSTQRLGISISTLFRIAEVQLFRRAVSSLTTAIVQGIQHAVTYQVRLQQVANVTGQTGTAFNALESQIRRVSEAYAIALPDAALAAQQALTSQLGDTARGFEVLDQAARLSVASGLDIASSTNLITTSLEAYGLQGENAARVTDLLFSASQRTRVPLNELQSVIGRAGVTARALGLDIEQVTGIFLTLAQQGRRPAEAMSLIEQIFNRLLTPTPALERAISSMGAASVQSAVQMFGLSNVLNRLSEVSERNPEVMAEIAGSLRSLKAILGVTGDEVINLEGNIRDLQNSTGGVTDALNQTLETGGQTIRQQFQTISNIFTVDVGDRLVNASVAFTNALGGIENAIDKTVAVVRILVTGYAAYRGAIIAATVINSPFITALFTTRAQLTATGVQVQTLSQRLATLRAALASIGPQIIATFAITAIVAFNEYQRVQHEEYLRRIEEQRSREQEAARERLQAIQREAEERNRLFNQQVAQTLRPAFQFSGQTLEVAREQFQGLIDTTKDFIDTFRTGTQGALDAMRQRLSDIRTQLEQIETDVRTSIRRIQSFREQVGRQTFSSALQFEEDPTRAIRLISERRSQLQREINQLFASGEREDVETARERLQELIQLVNEEQQRRVDIQRSLFEQQVRSGGVASTFNPITGRQEIQFRADLNFQHEQSVRLLQLQQALEQRRIELLREEETRLRNQQQIEAQRLRTSEAAIQALSEFRVFSSSGDFERQFRITELTDGFDAAAAQAIQRFNQLAENARSGFGGSAEQQLQFATFIAGLRTRFEDQIAARRRQNEITQHQRNLQNIQEEFETQQETSQRLNTQARTRIQNAVENVRTSLAAIQGVQGSQLLSTLGTVLGVPNEVASRAAVSIQNIQRSASGIRSALVALEQASTPEDAEQAAARLREAYATYQQTIQTIEQRAASDPNFQRVLQLQLSTGRTLAQELDTIQSRLNSVDVGITSLGRAADGLRQAEQALAAAGGNVAQQLGPAVQQLGPNAQNAVAPFETITQRTTTILQNMQRINQELRTAAQLQLQQQGLQNQQVPGRYHGGLVFGPSGKDASLIRATRGEFVMPVRQTQQFYGQLLAMRAGQIPKFQAGGRVSIGDVHIHTAQSAANINIREVGQKLRREIKQGNLRLD